MAPRAIPVSSLLNEDAVSPVASPSRPVVASPSLASAVPVAFSALPGASSALPVPVVPVAPSFAPVLPMSRVVVTTHELLGVLDSGEPLPVATVAVGSGSHVLMPSIEFQQQYAGVHVAPQDVYGSDVVMAGLDEDSSSSFEYTPESDGGSADMEQAMEDMVHLEAITGAIVSMTEDEDDIVDEDDIMAMAGEMADAQYTKPEMMYWAREQMRFPGEEDSEEEGGSEEEEDSEEEESEEIEEEDDEEEGEEDASDEGESDQPDSQSDQNDEPPHRQGDGSESHGEDSQEEEDTTCYPQPFGRLAMAPYRSNAHERANFYAGLPSQPRLVARTDTQRT